MSELASALLQNGVISQRVMDRALQRQAEMGGEIDTALLELGVMDENALNIFKAAHYGLQPASKHSMISVPKETLACVSSKIAYKFCILPLALHNRTLIVALAAAPTKKLARKLRRKLRFDIELRSATEVRLQLAQAIHYGFEISQRIGLLAQQLNLFDGEYPWDRVQHADPITVSAPSPGKQRNKALYKIGIALGRVAHRLRSGDRRLVNESPSIQRGRIQSNAPPSAHAELFSRLIQMQDRLQSVEQSMNDRQQPPALDSTGHLKVVRQQTRELPGDELNKALSDADPGVRRFALGAIDSPPDPENVLAILRALRDPELAVRYAAIAAASRVGALACVFTLILLLNDSNREIREQAKSAIENITERRIDFNPADGFDRRRQRVQQLNSWWKTERFGTLSNKINATLTSQESYA